MKSRKITKIINEYYDVCDVCGKEIKGTKASQVDFLMAIHKQSKECNKNE